MRERERGGKKLSGQNFFSQFFCFPFIRTAKQKPLLSQTNRKEEEGKRFEQQRPKTRRQDTDRILNWSNVELKKLLID